MAESLHLGNYVSVYQAELLSLMHALDCLMKCGVQGKKILIALDNQVVIRRLQDTDVTSSLVLECVLKLNDCARLNEVCSCGLGDMLAQSRTKWLMSWLKWGPVSLS